MPWASRECERLKRRALRPLHSSCVAAAHPAAHVLLKWLLAQAQGYLHAQVALTSWSAVIEKRICPRLVLPWNPARARWHRMYFFAIDILWNRRADLCESLNRACVGAHERLRVTVRTVAKLRAPVLSPFAGRLHTTLLDWARVAHRQCMQQQLALAYLRERIFWTATFGCEVCPRTRALAVGREDFVQLAWLRALSSVFAGLRDKRLRSYNMLGAALMRSRQDATSLYHTIKALTRVDTMETY
jgi:hypothetical protein